MLADGCSVRTAAGDRDLPWRGEKTLLWLHHPLHHAVRETAGEQVEQRPDRRRAVFLDSLPFDRRERGDGDRDVIHHRPSDDRLDSTAGDEEIDDRAIAHVRTAAGETIADVAEALQALAPRPAPKRLGDVAADDPYRLGGAAGPGGPLGRTCFGAGNPLADRRVFSPGAQPLHLQGLCRVVIRVPADPGCHGSRVCPVSVVIHRTGGKSRWLSPQGLGDRLVG